MISSRGPRDSHRPSEPATARPPAAQEVVTGRGAGLGTFGGVFTPSILTILGVIMYLRFGWVVGNVGLPATLLIVTPLAGHAALPMAVDGQPLPSLAPMLERVRPAVVNISTKGSYHGKSQLPDFLDDPFFKRFFDNRVCNIFGGSRRNGGFDQHQAVGIDLFSDDGKHLLFVQPI